MVHQGPFSRGLFRTSLSEAPTQEPSPANDLEKDYVFPALTLVTALSTITKEYTHKGKAQRANGCCFIPLTSSPQNIKAQFFVWVSLQLSFLPCTDQPYLWKNMDVQVYFTFHF